MTSNDQIILDHLLEDKKQKIAPDINNSDFFELFVTEELLKNYDLSYEEIEAGIVGNGNDGGIDSMFTLVNGQLVSDDSDFSNLKSNIKIDLILIQSKTSPSFSDVTIQRLITSTQELFNLTNSIENLEKRYNSKLLGIVKNFRQIFLSLSVKLPELKISYYYASKGDEIHPNVSSRVKTLEHTVKQIFSNADFSFEFIGARRLLNLARQSPSVSVSLKVAQNPISTEKGASICLVQLKDYYSFITDENGELRRGMFESNVRDYQGSVEVNRAIQNTLKEVDAEENFWWLNNGITIVASEAPFVSQRLTIKDPQVVNGLQTSMEIYNFYRKNPPQSVIDQRSVLVRVIIPPDEMSRNRIIKATNSQTNIPFASLWATDEIQEDIETYFATMGFYYDRRKNYYKNLGYPKDRIISIIYISQAVIAILLQEPSIARSGTSTFIRDNKNYKRVFNKKYPISMFLKCVKVMKAVDYFLESENAPDYVSGNEQNIRCQLAAYAASLKLQKTSPTGVDLLDINTDDFDSDFITNCLNVIWEKFQKIKTDTGRTLDNISKSREFDIVLKEQLHNDLGKGDFKIPLSVWEERLADFIIRNGHSSVSRENSETAELAWWVTELRNRKRKGLLSEEMVQRLEEIGFDWDPVANRWEQRYQELIEYKQKHGDCNVPRYYLENPALGHWVSNHKGRKDKLSPEKLKLLDDIGFIWKSDQHKYDNLFEQRINELLEFKKIKGHMNVSQLDPEFRQLGRWLNDQRTRKSRNQLSSERIKRLEEIGIVWNVLEARWEQRLSELKAFYERYGHFHVPKNYKEFPKLRNWVHKLKDQRPTPERLKKLKEIGYDWELEQKRIKREKSVEVLELFDFDKQ